MNFHSLSVLSIKNLLSLLRRKKVFISQISSKGKRKNGGAAYLALLWLFCGKLQRLLHDGIITAERLLYHAHAASLRRHAEILWRAVSDGTYHKAFHALWYNQNKTAVCMREKWNR